MQPPTNGTNTVFTAPYRDLLVNFPSIRSVRQSVTSNHCSKDPEEPRIQWAEALEVARTDGTQVDTLIREMEQDLGWRCADSIACERIFRKERRHLFLPVSVHRLSSSKSRRYQLWHIVLFKRKPKLRRSDDLGLVKDMIVAGRVVLGLGVGLEGGTVPVYVAETIERRRIRGHLVSLYQLMIALGEVLGYAVAAIFLRVVPGNWRYILSSSLFFSTIVFVGMLFLPQSPRYLIHKGRTLDAFKVWKRIRGVETAGSKQEFYIMVVAVRHEASASTEVAKHQRFPWMDFFTVPRARRALVYASIMILLGQLTGVSAIKYYMGFLVIGTIPAVVPMETCGRWFWTITMLPGFLIGLVLIGIGCQINIDTHTMAVEGCYLTGLIVYMVSFGSYGMTTSDAPLFLASFIVTYNFTAIEEAMTRTGLTLGFYDDIAVLDEIYQV
ncbi:General substrate transporter [Metarhizium rileyi]|uniref:General substrate transporter n=1 Tax=Metarhizium rileyi (strain RCEF 4871) TaxID=1649241 RepID=A0A167JR75_METRR|nr:General substrate transporter [Metarhizium rileyi RCEF 4871]